MKIFSFVLCVVLFSVTPTNAQERLRGDLDGNGVVDFADFLIFTANFGKTGGATFDADKWVDTLTVVDTLILHNTVVVRDTLWKETPKLKPKITVEAGAWGNTTLSTIQTVCESVRNAFSSPLVYALDSDIIVQHKEPEGPRILYNRHHNGSYIVWLDSEHNRWAQQIFQFAHEYGHILTNYRENSPYEQQRWFEESLASLASIYALKRLSEEWKTAPPNGDWRFQHYATNGALERYWQDIVKDIPTQSPDNFKQWYQQNRQQLESNFYLRDKNNIVALHLLNIFEDNPEAWNAIRYLNRGPLYKNQNFATYLEEWYRRTPTRWQPVVTEIRTRFGVSRVYKPAVVAHQPHPPNKGQD